MAGKHLLGVEQKEDRINCWGFVREHHQNTHLQRILTALMAPWAYLLLALKGPVVKINA